MKYQQPKGTFDLYPLLEKNEISWKNIHLWQAMIQEIHLLCKNYGFQEIQTPIFEKTDLFVRSVGDTSDIVTKELYTFQDKAGRSMSLRPEGTAGTLRAYIENHLYHKSTCDKLYYIGPFFRYDRPQAGRFRQFHQFGIEVIGNPSPYQDVEVIEMLVELYRRLGLQDLRVLLNSLGSTTSRTKYIQALQEFLQMHYQDLSEESQMRFHKNPLRILDTKNAKEKELLSKAPRLATFLTKEDQQHFDSVCHLLRELEIPFEIDDRLVRGLDYYQKTVFEITSGVLGAQNSIGGGGRYDGLIKDLGGPDLSGIGFATGLERILQTLLGQQVVKDAYAPPFLYLIPLGDKAKQIALRFTTQLRHKKINCDLDLKERKLSKSLQQAEEKKAFFVGILGENELDQKEIQIKEMATRHTQMISLDHLLEFIQKQWEKSEIYV